MTDFLIDSVVNRPKVEQDVDFVEAAINDVIAAIKATKGIGIDILNAKSFKEYNAAVKAAADGQIKAAQASAALAKAVQQEAKAKEASAKASIAESRATDTAAKSKDNKTKATEQSAKALAAEQKLLDQAIDDYFQLSKAYLEAANRAKNMYIRLGEGHPLTVQAIKDANDLGNVLKKADAAVGQFGKNVGNYKSAFDGLGFSFAQVGRELPALAINFQTFALAISNNLPIVADELAKATREIAALKAEGKETPSLFSRIGKAVFSMSTLLSVGIAAFTLFAGKLFGAGKAADMFSKELYDLEQAGVRVNKQIEALNKELDYLQKLSRLNIQLNFTNQFERDLRNANNDVVKVVDQIQFLEKKEKELQGNRIKAQSKFNEDASRGALEAAGLFATFADIPEDLINDFSKKDQRLFKAAKKSTEDLTDVQIKLAEKREEKNILLLDRRVLKEEDVRKKQKEGFEQEEKDREALFKVSVLYQQQIADAALIIADDERRSNLDRLRALRVAGIAQQEIIRLEKDFELERREMIEDKIVKVNRSNAQILLVNKEAANKEVSLARETQDRLDKIRFEERTQKEEKFLVESEIAKDIEARKDADRLGQEYDDYDKFYNDLSDRIKRYYSEKAKIEKDNAEKEKYYKEQRKKLEKELTQELIDLTSTLLTAGLERQKNELQGQINSIEERKKKDIEFASQTITNTQDRANEITRIEAVAQVNREQLERRQRQLEVERARFEKASSIASIIAKTAEAIIGFLAKPGGVHGVTLSIIAGAIGAAQLAKVIATPIPKYAKGTKSHRGGPFVGGDGGKHELVTEPTGRMWVTDKKATLYNAPKGTRVDPDAYSGVIHHTGVPKFSNRSTTEVLKPTIEAMGNKIVKAVKSMPQPIYKGENKLRVYLRKGHSFRRYLNGE